MPKRKVKQGECLLSIAAEVNVPWEVLWNHPENGKLKTKRKQPNILFPGDILFIPDLEKKEESSDSEKKHQFKHKRPKTCIRLNLIYDGKPMKKKKYRLQVDGKLHRGETDDKGTLLQVIEATAKEGILKVEGDESVHKLQLGYLDPVDTTSGLQARLGNLGFDVGDVDGDWGKLTRTSMQGFQSRKDLSKSTKPNDATRDKLTKEYGS